MREWENNRSEKFYWVEEEVVKGREEKVVDVTKDKAKEGGERVENCIRNRQEWRG